jgi:hypothetical protein
MSYLLVTAPKWGGSARVCHQPSKLVMRVRFPSPALQMSEVFSNTFRVFLTVRWAICGPDAFARALSASWPRASAMALAVGLALGTVRFPIVVAVTAFGVMTFVMSIIGLKLGGKLGTAAGEHGEVVGAIALIGFSVAMAAGWLLPGRERRQVTARSRSASRYVPDRTANRGDSGKCRDEA